LVAATELAAIHGPARVRFAEVIVRSGVPRATAYRIFPGGYESILMMLHTELVDEAVAAIRRAIRSIGGQIQFGEALAAGVEALLASLRSGRLTGILKSDPDLLNFYLLSRAPCSMLGVLARYAAGCAATYGSVASDLQEASQIFVWGVLADVVDDRQHSSDWPNPTRLKELLGRRIDSFLEDAQLNLDGASRLDYAIAPLAGAPDEYSDMHFMVMSSPEGAN
jgi:AcrR family transcriptional regulator